MRHIPGANFIINKPIKGNIKQYFRYGFTYILKNIIICKDGGIDYYFSCDEEVFCLHVDNVEQGDKMIDYLKSCSQ